ncbi:hypothetical protein QOZ80_5BG0420380 [Eleusine coracana subsp. coracana]|nr:hypothetical protein QOZ80_5BG0420380 [Eleusine coracana subsp. coracana]
MEVGWLVCPIIKIVIDKARSCASERIKWLGSGSVGDALRQVEQMLVQLSTVAGVVEKRTSTGTSADLRAWLQQLKDAVYDADDVLDDFDGSAPQPGSYVATVGKRILGTDEPLNRLKEVLKTLETVYASSDKLMQAAQLEASGSGELSGQYSLDSRATGSVCRQEQVVFGRDKELRDMVAWLVGASDGDARPLLSVPIAVIMGHGGMGKTTLAQQLFQDQTVASTFDLKIWVRPKATDNTLELVTQILQSAEVEVPDRTNNLDCLQKRLQKAVSSRRFLLGIDDVWNMEDTKEKEHLYREMWTKVLAPLSEGKTTGSKIVITSRQRSVAKLLDARKEVWLDGLRDDDIWSLLKRSAFAEEDIDKHPQLQHIGRQIAEKLRGSPLAAMAVGQMLKDSRSTTEWRKVLDMNIFDNVSSTLELCYQNLPKHLQPCFAICSIFPKNWKFKRERLVKIWMALDFIVTAGGVPLEEEGGKYFDQLVDRSFFHKQKVGRRRYYYIHDLMHDLAEKVSWSDCIRVEGIKKEIPKTVRHLSVFSDAMEMLQSPCDLKRLRTLVILNNPSSPLNQLPDGLLTELKGLRVLCLEGCNTVDLPNNISHLKHLRYLALCKSITRLPRTMTKLYHLQTLRCPKRSRLEEIPKGITNLKCLRHLDMDTSKIAGIGKLVHLQGSVEFHVKNERGHTLDDLNGMSSLRKELHIKNLEVVTSLQNACQAGLKKKENLRMLELEWNSTDRSVASVADDVLDGLEPPQHIKKLHIRRYPGKRSPNWLNRSLKGNEFYIRYLYLINCRKWEVLPPLGQLPCLKVLHIKEMCSVTQINQEFYGTNSPAFPSLEELQFEDMPDWFEWTQEDRNIKVLPELCKLKLSDCPVLIKVPPLPLSKRIRMVSVKNSGFASQLQLSLASSSKSNRIFPCHLQQQQLFERTENNELRSVGVIAKWLPIFNASSLSDWMQVNIDESTATQSWTRMG